jgi:hypothetical protein
VSLVVCIFCRRHRDLQGHKHQRLIISEALRDQPALALTAVMQGLPDGSEQAQRRTRSRSATSSTGSASGSGRIEASHPCAVSPPSQRVSPSSSLKSQPPPGTAVPPKKQHLVLEEQSLTTSASPSRPCRQCTPWPSQQRSADHKTRQDVCHALEGFQGSGTRCHRTAAAATAITTCPLSSALE